MTERTVTIEHPDDKIVEGLVFDIIRRSKMGLIKYECDMAHAKMGLRDALVNALEEATDQAVYLAKAIYEYDRVWAAPAVTVEGGLVRCNCADCSMHRNQWQADTPRTGPQSFRGIPGISGTQILPHPYHS